MRLSSGPQSLDLRVTEVLSSALPRPGDLRLEARLSGEGFEGASSAWVDADTWRAFASQLADLVAHFRGVAVLESMSPGEMSLHLAPANGRGYVRVAVALAGFVTGERWAISGGFDVELSAAAALQRWAEVPSGQDA
jgi:hypothetical protein